MDITYIYLIIIAVTGLLGPLLTILITKVFDERKFSKELIIKTAIENWKASIDVCKFYTEKTGNTSTIYPLEDFIIHAISFNKLFNKKDIKEKDVIEIMKKINDTQEYMDKQREKRQQKMWLISNKNNKYYIFIKIVKKCFYIIH